MIIQLLLFCLIILIAPYMPRVLTPLSYSIASVSLVEKINPRLIWLLFVVFSTLAIVILRYIEWYIINKVQIYQKKVNYTDFLSRQWEKIKKYLESKKNNHKGWSNLKKHLASDKGQRTLFILAVIGFMPTIPDFLTVALLQKKLKFWYLVSAAIVWKILQFFPFIFLGKWFLTYFKL